MYAWMLYILITSTRFEHAMRSMIFQLTIVHRSWNQTQPLYIYIHTHKLILHIQKRQTITLFFSYVFSFTSKILKTYQYCIYTYLWFVDFSQANPLLCFCSFRLNIWFSKVGPRRSSSSRNRVVVPYPPHHFEGENLLGYLPTRSTCSVSWRLCRGKSARGQICKQQISD